MNRWRKWLALRAEPTRWVSWCVVVALTGALPAAFAAGESRITDEVIPLEEEAVPGRPFTLELGERFLGPGNIAPVFEIPTGAVWQPSLLLFGALRTALQSFDNGSGGITEWANRLDLFAQLRLTGTERILIGIRPLDKSGDFTGYNFHPDDEFFDAVNGNIRTLFFEGELTELFPNLDPEDRLPLDIGLSVGRQPLFFQEGMLIDEDSIDAVGITRDSMSLFGVPDLRVTALYAWNNINRGNNQGQPNPEDDSAHLIGLFTETDFICCTVDLDVIYVLGDAASGDGFFAGLSSIQRIGHFSTSFRINTSVAVDEETPDVRDGTLLFAEASWTPPRTHDNLYATAFWGIDRFTSAARGPTLGGPLGRAGILFAAVGLGQYGAALGNQPEDSAGGAIGYQRFLGETRKQLIVEFGGRTPTDGDEDRAIAIGARYQQALLQNFVLQVDTFYADHEQRGDGYGARGELRVQF